MLNIISKSIRNGKTRGPKKVVENLMLGLKKINYPFVINKDLNCCSMLWIHDDIDALFELDRIDKNIGVIVGPNLFVNPENIPKKIDLSRVIYIQPSNNVKKVWLEKGYNRSPVEVWPVGIDSEKFCPGNEVKDTVIIYFKNRKESEINFIEKKLEKRNIVFRTIRYGAYKEDEYKEILRKSKYMIWIGCFESQGVAIEEAMSCNVPILVLDNQDKKTSFDTHGTSAPYFDERCGIILKDIDLIDENIEKMENSFSQFNPRNYILENLGLEEQARKFVKFYEMNFHDMKADHETTNIDLPNYKISFLKKIINVFYKDIDKYQIHRICIKIYKKTIYKIIQKINILIFILLSKDKKTVIIKNGEINH